MRNSLLQKKALDAMLEALADPQSATDPRAQEPASPLAGKGTEFKTASVTVQPLLDPVSKGVKRVKVRLDNQDYELTGVSVPRFMKMYQDAMLSGTPAQQQQKLMTIAQMFMGDLQKVKQGSLDSDIDSAEFLKESEEGQSALHFEASLDASGEVVVAATQSYGTGTPIGGTPNAPATPTYPSQQDQQQAEQAQQPIQPQSAPGQPTAPTPTTKPVTSAVQMHESPKSLPPRDDMRRHLDEDVKKEVMQGIDKPVKVGADMDDDDEDDNGPDGEYGTLFGKPLGNEPRQLSPGENKEIDDLLAKYRREGLSDAEYDRYIRLSNMANAYDREHTPKCEDCGNYLLGFERQGTRCNECLSKASQKKKTPEVPIGDCRLCQDQPRMPRTTCPRCKAKCCMHIWREHELPCSERPAARYRPTKKDKNFLKGMGIQGAQKQADTVQVPLMMTRRMQEQLRGLGYSQAEIDRMTPAQAHSVIQNSEWQTPSRWMDDAKRAKFLRTFGQETDKQEFLSNPDGWVKSHLHTPGYDGLLATLRMLYTGVQPSAEPSVKQEAQPQAQPAQPQAQPAQPQAQPAPQVKPPAPSSKQGPARLDNGMGDLVPEITPFDQWYVEQTGQGRRFNNEAQARQEYQKERTPQKAPTCPNCGRRGGKPLTHQYSEQFGEERLFECPACGAFFTL